MDLINRAKELEVFGMKTAEDNGKIIKLLNMAIGEVYADLDFCTEQVTIPLVAGQSNYDLPNRLVAIRDQYRQFNKVPNDIHRYYGTSFHWPLEDEKTFWVPINTFDHRYGIAMQTPFRINVKNPDEGGKVLLSCTMVPQEITEENMGDGTFQVYPQIVEVIMNKLVYLVYKKKNGHNAETKTYWAAYMNSLDALNQSGLISKANTLNTKLEQKGFV